MWLPPSGGWVELQADHESGRETRTGEGGSARARKEAARTRSDYHHYEWPFIVWQCTWRLPLSLAVTPATASRLASCDGINFNQYLDTFGSIGQQVLAPAGLLRSKAPCLSLKRQLRWLKAHTTRHYSDSLAKSKNAPAFRCNTETILSVCPYDLQLPVYLLRHPPNTHGLLSQPFVIFRARCGCASRSAPLAKDNFDAFLYGRTLHTCDLWHFSIHYFELT